MLFGKTCVLKYSVANPDFNEEGGGGGGRGEGLHASRGPFPDPPLILAPFSKYSLTASLFLSSSKPFVPSMCADVSYFLLFLISFPRNKRKYNVRGVCMQTIRSQAACLCAQTTTHAKYGYGFGLSRLFPLTSPAFPAEQVLTFPSRRPMLCLRTHTGLQLRQTSQLLIIAE